MVATQLYTKSVSIIKLCYKGVNFTVSKLHFNKPDLKEYGLGHPAPFCAPWACR